MKYIVKSLYLGGLGNKVFKSGDEVTEANFPDGNAAKLVQQGYLIEAEPQATTDNRPAYESITKSDIIEILTYKGIPFNANAEKRALYNLL